MVSTSSPGPIDHSREIQTCTSCGQEAPGDARFCPACGTALAGPRREVRKTVTCLFSDLANSTALGEQLDPETLRRVLARYYQEMRQVCEAHGAQVREFLGDAVMAVFGVPQAHEDDALRAVAAAVEMRERLAHLNDEAWSELGIRLATRTGLNTGEVVAPDSAESQTLVLGDAVNTAARLEQGAQADEILIGEETHRLVRDAVRAEAIEPLVLKGKREPVSVYRVLELLPERYGVARHFEASLVGRQRELQLLHQTFLRTKHDRRSHLVTLFGDVGIGKTRLAHELAAVTRNEATVLTGRCLSYGEGIAYFPLAEIVHQLIAERSLSHILAELEEGDVVAERVAATVGLVEGRAGRETPWAFRRLFETIAFERPLLLVFEDLQWADSILLDLIDYLCEWIREAPVFVLCLARPELLEQRPDWGGGKLNATSMLLSSLSAADAQQLVERLSGGQLADGDARRIVETSGGNPLFLEQLLAHLNEEGDDGTPPAIEALLAARLDRLDSDERAVIQRASIEGEIAHVGAVVALSPELSPADVEHHLTTLVRKELLGPEPAEISGQDAYRFRHLLVRETAYEGIPKLDRSNLHIAYVDWAEQAAAERIGEIEEILGYHLEQGYRYRVELGQLDAEAVALGRRASDTLASAGRRAFDRADMPTAARLLRRSLALLPAEDRSSFTGLPDLSFVLYMTDSLNSAIAVLEEETPGAQPSDSARLNIDVLRRWWGMFTDSSEAALESARDQTKRAIEFLAEERDTRGLARAWMVLSDLATLEGRAEDTRLHAEQAIRHAIECGAWPYETWARAAVAYAILDGPMPAREGYRRCRDLIEEADDPTVEAHLGVFEGAHEALMGNLESAREKGELSVRLTRELGLVNLEGVGELMRTRTELLADDLESAERHARRAAQLLRQNDDAWLLSIAHIDLTRALLGQERVEEATEICDAFVAGVAPPDPEITVKGLATRARLMLAQGESEEALSLAQEAVRIAEHTDFIGFHADALVDRAEILRAVGDDSSATECLREALTHYERKGNVVSAGRVRALLEEVE